MTENEEICIINISIYLKQLFNYDQVEVAKMIANICLTVETG